MLSFKMPVIFNVIFAILIINSVFLIFDIVIVICNASFYIYVYRKTDRQADRHTDT